ncbi:MAG: hypothetical protein ACREGD_00450 [Candidatus Saccharimonadales bacterium]
MRPEFSGAMASDPRAVAAAVGRRTVEMTFSRPETDDPLTRAEQLIMESHIVMSDNNQLLGEIAALDRRLDLPQIDQDIIDGTAEPQKPKTPRRSRWRRGHYEL